RRKFSTAVTRKSPLRGVDAAARRLHRLAPLCPCAARDGRLPPRPSSIPRTSGAESTCSGAARPCSTSAPHSIAVAASRTSCWRICAASTGPTREATHYGWELHQNPRLRELELLR